MLKIALCHLDWSMGPLEKNIKLLVNALELAGEKGADWVITPETALQGYYFHKKNKEVKVDVQPAPYLDEIIALLKKYNLYLFLGCGEYVLEDECNYNVCTILGPDGNVVGKHKKTHAYGISEEWAECGKEFEVFELCGVKVAPLVCADAWYPEAWESIKKQGAELVVDIAAWPPTEVCGNPLPTWQKRSADFHLPLVLCNQTGDNPWMDMKVGQSVVIVDGQCLLCYEGEAAILFFEWNKETRMPLGQKFEVCRL